MTKRQISLWIMGLIVGAIIAGCDSSLSVASANDRLREKVVDLQKQIKLQNGQIANLKSRVSEAEASATVSEELRDNTPRVASILIGSLSHLRDNSGDGKVDELVAYIESTDGWGRSIQLTGQLSVHAVAMPIGYDAITLGRISLGPAAVRQAYRSSIVGTHYTVIVALLVPQGTIFEDITIKADYVDGYSGIKYSAQQQVDSDGPFDFAGKE